ncbi:hypothetical protein Tco_0104457 [Tanacetum coccineum]
MDSLSEVSAYLNELESMLDDGESPMKKEDLVKEGTEIERIDAMEIVENVPKKVKHEVVVFTKAPYHEYCEPCIRSSTPCMVKGNQAWDAELNMAYYDSYMSEDMLNTLGYVRLDHGEYGRKMVKNVRVMIHGSFLLTTKSQVDFRIGEMRVDVTMLKEEMDIDTLLTNFVEDMDEVGDTSGEKVHRALQDHHRIRSFSNTLDGRRKGQSILIFNWLPLVIDPCVLAILKGSFDPVSPFIRQTAELRITKPTFVTFGGFRIARSIEQTQNTNSEIMEMEPDIENMTLNEYLEYEAKKERRSWRNARSKSSLTRYEGADINSSHHDKSITLDFPHYYEDSFIDKCNALTPLLPCFRPFQPHNERGYQSPNMSNEFFAQPPNTPNTPVDKKDFDFDEILDDVFKIGAENLRRMGQEKVQNGCDDDTSRDTNHESGNLLNFPIFPATNEFSSICEQDVDLEKEEAQVEDDDDGDTYDIWDITVKDVERIRLLAKNPLSHFTEIQVHSVIGKPEPFIYTQPMSPLYGVIKSSQSSTYPYKVGRDITSPECFADSNSKGGGILSHFAL